MDRLSRLSADEIARVCRTVDENLANRLQADWRGNQTCDREEVERTVRTLVRAERDTLAMIVIESNEQYEQNR